MPNKDVTETNDDVPTSVIKATPETLEAFIEQYSPEFVQGYFHALNAFCKDALLMAYRQIGENTYFPYSHAVIQKNINVFQAQINELLSGLDAHGIKLHQPTTDKTKLG
ncbi:MAG TPA: hypothetical protein VGE58_12850 [Daejeonella sp.]